MREIETHVAEHYDVEGLRETILQIAEDDLGRLQSDILEAIDEFHLGGAAATARLIDGMGLGQGSRLLDVGCGIGGPARRAARLLDARVTGLDLTEGFVALAEELSDRIGEGGQTEFQQGSVLDMPFEDGEFDAAMMLHVGMNIADKPRLFAEVARVLRPGGVFAVYDVMRTSETRPQYPLPWAPSPSLSFVDTAQSYRAAAMAAGLEVVKEIDRHAEAEAFLDQMRAIAMERQAAGQPPAPGVGMVMGADAPQKLANIGQAIRAHHLSAIEIHFRKPGPQERLT